MSIFPMFTHTLDHPMLAKIEAVEVDGCALLSIKLGSLPRQSSSIYSKNMYLFHSESSAIEYLKISAIMRGE
jgi:hypothetical protein